MKRQGTSSKLILESREDKNPSLLTERPLRFEPIPSFSDVLKSSPVGWAFNELTHNLGPSCAALLRYFDRCTNLRFIFSVSVKRSTRQHKFCLRVWKKGLTLTRTEDFFINVSFTIYSVIFHSSFEMLANDPIMLRQQYARSREFVSLLSFI